MKDETKKKIKKGALIALQVTLAGFALLGMISTGALVKSCSKGEIDTTSVVATTPVVGQRVKKANASGWSDLRGHTFKYNGGSFPTGTFSGYMETESGSNHPYVIGTAVKDGVEVTFNTIYFYRSSPTNNVIRLDTATSSGTSYFVYQNGVWNSSYSTQITFKDIAYPYSSGPRSQWLTAFNALFDLDEGVPLTTDYAYCSPVGTLPTSVPQDYTSVTIQFQADTGYGFPDTGEEIPGYTQIYSEGLVIDSYTYGGYLGNGMYNAIEIQCSRDSDPPAESCHISVSALATAGFEYPEWKTLRVLGTHCTIYMASDQFDSEGVVRLQAYPDTGYYFDQERAFIGNQLKEYYGAEVVMYDLSTGGLYLTVRKNTENLVLNESPYIEITPLAGSVPVGGGDMGQAFDLLRDGFSALLPLFMIQVLPGITLGMLFMVPFIVILILFILKVVHK